jgi:hypothetical protein
MRQIKWFQKQTETRRIFFVDLRGPVPWDDLPNLGSFAVWNSLPSHFSNSEILGVAKNTDELRDLLQQLTRSGMFGGAYRICVQTATSEKDFTDVHYERLIWSVLNGIQTIKSRGDQATLRRARNALESKGMKPGPKAQSDSNRWMIELLHRLSTGMLLKEAVKRPRKPSSASAQLSVFCNEFYQICTWLDAETPDSWQTPKSAKAFLDRLGIRFPQDLSAAMEAYRRGKKSFDRAVAKSKEMELIAKTKFVSDLPL